jgi:long-chain acyl-CoA synthetase
VQLETVNELFLEREKRHPVPRLLRYKTDGQWSSISSEEFGEKVRATSQGLVSLGVGPGDRVALLSETRWEWTVADHAILAAAAVTVPIYPTLLPEQMLYILRDAEPRAVFCSDQSQVDKVRAIRGQCPSIEHITTFDPADRADVLSLAKLEQLGRVRRAERPEDFSERAGSVGRDDLATLIYTSGTTGEPKGVMLTHDNLVQNVLNTLEVLEIQPEDVALSFLPLSHVLERLAHYFLLYAGSEIAYAESIQQVPANLAEVRPTVMVSVPRLYEKIYEKVISSAEAAGGMKRRIFHWSKETGRRIVTMEARGEKVPAGLRIKGRVADRLVFSKIRAATGGQLRKVVSGGAPLSKEIAEFFHSAGIPILEGYGLTETSPVITVNPPDRVRFGSVGRPIPNVEVRIAEDGEILTRSRSVMKGYYRKPQDTAEVLVDGWLHTGDVGHLDDDGYLYITDRKKDIIVTAGGKNVAPQPIEASLKLDKMVAEAAVLGDRRKYLVALIVPSFEELESWARGSGLGLMSRDELLGRPEVIDLYQSLLDRVNAGLPRYEQVKKFALIEREFTIDGGELTPTMKVKRRVVQQKYTERIETLYGEDA